MTEVCFLFNCEIVLTDFILVTAKSHHRSLRLTLCRVFVFKRDQSNNFTSNANENTQNSS